MKKRLRQCLQYFAVFVVMGLCPITLFAQAYGYLPPQEPRKSSRSESKTELRTAILDLQRKYRVDIIFEEKLLEGITVEEGTINLNKDFDYNIKALLVPYRLTYRKLKENSYVIISPKGDAGYLNQIAPQEQSLEKTSQSDLVSMDRRAMIAVVMPRDFTVSGKVTSLQGEELPGVTVVAKGTTIGTVTDMKGDFNLSLPDNTTTLVFSFVGYTTQEVAINNRTKINISLAEDIKALQEVVVVGYGEQRKVTLTGSVSTIKGSEIVQSPATNITNSLAGRLPGLVTITPGGEPGYDGSTLRVRGVNSLGNNDPLIVVDGVPGRSLERLDPNSIESITLLKDASAAIYGAQAANGVLLVTTKRGKQGKPQITLSLNQGYGRATRIPEMANAAEFATLLNEIQVYRGRTPRYTDEEIQKFADGSDPWNYPNTDWFKETLKPWSGQNYGNIQIAGGSESMRYFVSMGAKSQDGYYKNSAAKYNQYDFRSNLDGKISKNVSLGVDIAGRMEDRNFPVRGAGTIFRMVMRGLPTMAAVWPNGQPGPDLEYGDNPVVVSTKASGTNRDKWYYLQSNMKLAITIPWVKGLSVTANTSLDKGFRFRKVFEKPWYLYSYDKVASDAAGSPVLIKSKKGFDDPRLTEETEDNLNVMLNARVDYEKTINEFHTIKLMAGLERRQGRGDRFNAYRRYFVSDAVDQMFAGGDKEKNNGGSAYQNARLNYFGRFNYNYREKYLVEFVGRYDGSYIFPESKRFGFFPAVSAGWRVSQEPFWKENVSFVQNFKLRTSFGQTGNDRIDEWQYLSTYVFNPNNWTYIFGVNQENKRLYETRIPNKNITWEIANQFNFGLDASLLNNRLTVEADYFNYTRSQILWWRNVSVPTSSGLSLPRENIGKVANRGFDFNLTYSNNNQGAFGYSVGINGGYQKNKVIFMDEVTNALEYQKSTGRPIPTNPLDIGADLYYQAIGIYKTEDEVAATPHWNGARAGDIIFKDVNGDGEINANDRVRNEKSNIPRFTGGFTLNLTYKNFDLTALFQGASGAVKYIDTETGDNGNFLKEFYDKRWTAENPNASYPRTFNRADEYWKGNRNTFWLRKTDYIRLKNLELGYTIPKTVITRLGVQNLRIYVSGLNLFTYTPDLKDFDPELSGSNNSNSSSGQSYPLQKIVNGGLTLTF